VSPEEEEEIKWAASSLYSGGADTVRTSGPPLSDSSLNSHHPAFFLQPVSAMTSFLLAMTMYPEVQKKCQAELDDVVGNDRLPTFGDRDRLPYLATMLKEVIRWGPTTPLGAPHCVEQDDVHNGYFIPKGSIIMPNIWYVIFSSLPPSFPRVASLLSFAQPALTQTTGTSCTTPRPTRIR